MLSIRISFAYRATTVAGASPVFANNIGTGGLVNVYNGTLVLSSTAATSSPQAFDIIINLMHNFTYNPALGNLLLDISVFNSPSGNFFLEATGTDTTTTRILSDDVKCAPGDRGLHHQFPWALWPGNSL